MDRTARTGFWGLDLRKTESSMDYTKLRWDSESTVLADVLVRFQSRAEQRLVGQGSGRRASGALFVFVPEEEKWKDGRMATAHKDRQAWMTYITRTHIVPLPLRVTRPDRRESGGETRGLRRTGRRSHSRNGIMEVPAVLDTIGRELRGCWIVSGGPARLSPAQPW